MKYKEFITRDKFSQEELIAFSYGTLVDDPPGEFTRLPAPPFLMVDRITNLERKGKRGKIIAEKDISMDEWFFQCHFVGDPVQPGCLGVDAVWQLIGFFIVANGVSGFGRALGCGEVEFNGQIRPYDKLVRYEVDIRRFTVMKEQGAALCIGNGKLFVDGEHIYTIKGAKVGVFPGIGYTDYPKRSKNSVGGLLSGSDTGIEVAFEK